MNNFFLQQPRFDVKGDPAHPADTELYEKLGITCEATDKDISRAYKKLSLKHHPDRGGDQDEFKNIQFAKDILSDESTRFLYDSFGLGFNDVSNVPLFLHMHKTNPIKVIMNMKIEEIYNGVKKTIKYDANVLGQIEHCESYIHIKPRNLQDVDTNFEGIGNKVRGKLRGDLDVNIRVMPHERFKMDNSGNLISEETISLIDFMTKSNHVFTHLDGKRIKINFKDKRGLKDVYKIQGLGLYKDSDLVIHFNVIIPTVSNKVDLMRLIGMPTPSSNTDLEVAAEKLNV